MKFVRALRRTFGIAAPRLTVRTHVAWYWRWLFMVTTVAVGAGLAWWMFDIGSQFAGFDRSETRRELARLTDMASHLQQENRTIQTEAAGLRRDLQIESTTKLELAKTVQALQDDNAHLKEDLSFFRNLMSAEGKADTLRIFRFKVERESLPGEYRYRLLVLQSGQREHEFRGSATLSANILRNGKKAVIYIPVKESGKTQAVDLNFKYYQRVEGTFKLEPGVVVKSVDVKVFESGAMQPKLSQSVNLS